MSELLTGRLRRMQLLVLSATVDADAYLCSEPEPRVVAESEVTKIRDMLQKVADAIAMMEDGIKPKETPQ